MATDKLVDFDHVTDYISREAALEAAKAHYPKANEMIAGIILIPAADVRPVVRARWKAHGDCGVTECPVCRWSIEECIDYNFCPCCGADMREPNLDTTKGEA